MIAIEIAVKTIGIKSAVSKADDGLITENALINLAKPNEITANIPDIKIAVIA